MSAEYLITIGDARQLKQLLSDGESGVFFKGRREPRMVMVGRSNVGKSSLINSLLDTDQAQVSKQPGKTRKIHFYLWKEAARIVADLPGYGFARASATAQRDWEKFIAAYLEADAGIDLALVLLDSRHGPTPLDVEALSFLRDQAIPTLCVFTKSDALRTQKERAARLKETTAALTELGLDPKESVWVSSRTGDGIRPLIGRLKAAR